VRPEPGPRPRLRPAFVARCPPPGPVFHASTLARAGRERGGRADRYPGAGAGSRTLPDHCRSVSGDRRHRQRREMRGGYGPL